MLSRGAQESKAKLSQLVSKKSMVVDCLMSSLKQCDEYLVQLWIYACMCVNFLPLKINKRYSILAFSKVLQINTHQSPLQG